MPVAHEEAPPVAQGGLDARDVDSSLAPDQVERGVREVEAPHVGDASLQAVGEAKTARFQVQFVDERRVYVDGDDAGRAALGHDPRLRTGPAADVENAGFGPDVGNEGEGPERAGGITGSLPRQSAEQLEE